MVALNSSMLPLGSPLIPFELTNYNPRFSTKIVSVGKNDVAKGCLIAVISNHCPYVINLAEALGRVGNYAQQQGFQVVAIGCNDIDNYPADAPEHIPEFAEKYGFDFAYCFDSTQSVAEQYKAVCTPDFFLFNNEGKLVYRGQLDDSRPGNNIKPTGDDLQQAIEQLLAGQPVSEQQTPSLGCSIKWRTA